MTTIDAGEIEPEHTIQTDLCIVGAGAAGLAIARELAASTFDICLMEAGGRHYKRSSQELYAGYNVGLPTHELTLSRYRVLGGSTTQWAGQCAPLDEIDFESRAWIPYSGWPFQRDHLEPYYHRAHEMLNLGMYDYSVDAIIRANRPLLAFGCDALRAKGFRYCRRTDLRELHRREIEPASNVRTFLNASAVDIELHDGHRSVRRVHFRTPGEKLFFVEASTYAIATGGIENARLLLASNRQLSSGIGNQHDLVGRYFMDHPFLFTGVVNYNDTAQERNVFAVDSYDSLDSSDWRVANIQFSPEYLEREKLTNCAVSFVRRPASKTTARYYSSGVQSMQALRDALGTGIFAGPHWSRHLERMALGAKDVVVSQLHRLSNVIRNNDCVAIRATLEQAPNPNSRVRLSAKRDSLGLPRVEVDWRLGSMERRSLEHFHDVLAGAFTAAGIGTLDLMLDDDENGWPGSMAGGKHHMGVTRMHADPSQGVVDDQCAVHGVSNLYVTGSSVFPSVGCANPTLTIIALAIRLAEHLRKTALTPAGNRRRV